MLPYRVMFICTGNICRSPLAHVVFETMVSQENLQDKIFVESSGTSAWHAGEPADARMCQTSARHGIELNHLSRQLIKEDLVEYDILLTMDANNYRDTLVLSTNSKREKKVQMFRDFDPEGPGDVPDPWYGGMDGFETVWTMVERTCKSLLKEIRRKIPT